MKQVKSQDKTIAYNVEGKGFPVIFIHGFCEDSHMWDDFKQDLLEEKFKVIAIDLPGFGKSSVVLDPSIDIYAQAVLKVIKTLKIDSCILIGHSMGGYVALAIAEIKPELLLGLGLFHSHPYEDSKEKKSARIKQIDFIGKYGHQLYVKQLMPKLFPKRHVLSSPFDIDKLVHRAARFPEEGITGALKAMATRPDRSTVLKNIKCPVLFIVGTEDNAIAKELSQKQLPLPAIAKVHILEGVGHMAMFERKRPVQLIVRRFVDFCRGIT